MASKGFENKDSRTEKQEGGKQSGGPNFDVLGLMKIQKDIEKNVGQAVDGLMHLFGQAEQANHKDTQDFKRGSLLNAGEHGNDQKKVLTGHLSHNESVHAGQDQHHLRGALLNRLKHDGPTHQNPSHLSAFLLKRLHEREGRHPTQATIQPQSFQFDQPTPINQQSFDQQSAQNPQRSEAPQWRQDMYNARRDLAQATMDAAVPVVSAMPFSEFNPNNPNVNRADLSAQGMPFTRGVQEDFNRVMEHVVRPVMERRAEKFQSQMSNVGHGSFHSYASSRVSDNYYQGQHNQLPYGGFKSNISYYRREM
ncbi:MAG: hypothetical protein K2Y22_11840 [Candidatus Obscuribacterales bacterium]|nr:hypothetical protein [Candidatus Obscuribacterales bacterium]